jgi:hypothetical protein
MRRKIRWLNIVEMGRARLLMRGVEKRKIASGGLSVGIEQ